MPPQFNISHPVIQFCFYIIFVLVFGSYDFRVQNYKKNNKAYINGSLKFEITAKRLYAASQRVL